MRLTPAGAFGVLLVEKDKIVDVLLSDVTKPKDYNIIAEPYSNCF